MASITDAGHIPSDQAPTEPEDVNVEYDEAVPVSLVVVGRANAGKSTLVATLTEDDSIQISDIRGTTLEARKWIVRVGNKPLLSIIDTPGFEDAVGALHEIKKYSSSAADRANAVRTFIQEAERTNTFLMERRLLKPILDGGAVLYVADATNPWRKNVEAELEILRWAGQPRAGLVNRTGERDYTDMWTTALGQYCSIVRSMSARDAAWEDRISLIRDISALHAPWRESLQKVADQLSHQWHLRRQRAATIIASMLLVELTHTRKERVHDPDDLGREKEQLEQSFAQDYRNFEKKAQTEIQKTYGFKKLVQTQQQEMEAPRLNQDLFSKAAWDDLGLTTGQILAGGAAGGAVSGLGVDLLLGGHSLGLGALIGAGVGVAGAAYHQREQIPSATVRSIKKITMPDPLSMQTVTDTRRVIVVGPNKNVRFPWVLLKRALGYWYAVEKRTHAQEGDLHVEVPQLSAREYPDALRKELQRIFSQPKATHTQALEELVLELYQHAQVQEALTREAYEGS